MSAASLQNRLSMSMDIQFSGIPADTRGSLPLLSRFTNFSKIRVPTGSGKPGNLSRPFPVRKKSGKMKILGKFWKKSGEKIIESGEVQGKNSGKKVGTPLVYLPANFFALYQMHLVLQWWKQGRKILAWASVLERTEGFWLLRWILSRCYHAHGFLKLPQKFLVAAIQELECLLFGERPDG